MSIDKINNTKLSEEEKKAIENLKDFKSISILYGNKFVMFLEQLKKYQEATDTILNLVTKLQKENEEKDKYIKHSEEITTEMNNDINKLLSEIKEKDKQIDLILDVFFKRFTAQLVLEYGIENKEQLKQKFEQYFKRKAEQQRGDKDESN